LFRIQDKGLPGLRSANRGDLVAIVQLVVPRKLTDAQKKLLGDYALTESVDISDSNPTLWNKIKEAVSGSDR
jgi:DnaJ-class molecular chaperone